MHYISGLPYGEILYEKCFPTSSELQQMEESLPVGVSKYWEVLYHFNICMDLYERWKGGISFAKWERVLITNTRSSKKLKASSHAEVECRVKDLEN